MAVNVEQWQKEADLLVAQSGSRVLKALRPRIRFDLRPGAYIRSRPVRLIYIPAELCHCPADVQRYILLHELGHLRYLHVYSLMPFLYLFAGALADFPPYSFLDSHSAEILVRVLVVVFIAFAFVYAGVVFPPYFEGAADDHAVKVMGKARVRRAMQWIICNTGKFGNARARNWRLRRLA